MNFRNSFKRSAVGVLSLLVLTTAYSFAQSPTVVKQKAKPMSVAGSNNLYCAGYVQSSAVNTANRIVGAVEEQEQFLYAQNDLVYINMGTEKGVKDGDVFSVVRPRGRVETRWSTKDDLGIYVQEVGTVEVLKAKNGVSAARVKVSCDTFLLGDLVQPVEQRSGFVHESRGPLDLFADPSGKASGRVFMARDGQEMLTRDQIVYIDLGADNNIQTGDRLTVFRPLGTGHLFISDEKETVSARDEGFQSREFRGGKFSNQAARKMGSRAHKRVMTTERAKKFRPEMRKVVGEIVVLNVKEKTATAVITRTAQEIHTGDWVELQ